MAKTIRIFEATITVSGGAGYTSIDNTTSRPIVEAGGYITQVLVKAPDPMDLFNFYIADEDNFIVYRRNNVTGEIIEEKRIPVKGSYGIYITSASRGGSYLVKLMFEELW